jgi:hypothetical protein
MGNGREAGGADTAGSGLELPDFSLGRRQAPAGRFSQPSGVIRSSRFQELRSWLALFPPHLQLTNDA